MIAPRGGSPSSELRLSRHISLPHSREHVFQGSSKHRNRKKGFHLGACWIERPCRHLVCSTSGSLQLQAGNEWICATAFILICCAPHQSPHIASRCVTRDRVICRVVTHDRVWLGPPQPRRCSRSKARSGCLCSGWRATKATCPLGCSSTRRFPGVRDASGWADGSVAATPNKTHNVQCSTPPHYITARPFPRTTQYTQSTHMRTHTPPSLSS